MPALNFKKQFAPLVQSGVKTHTIRGWRKRPFKDGDRLSFYTGSRFKPRRLRKPTFCTVAIPIIIDTECRSVILYAFKGSIYSSRLRPDGLLNQEEIALLAKNDGFESVDAFFKFFETEHCVHFTGQLIEWRA